MSKKTNQPITNSTIWERDVVHVLKDWGSQLYILTGTLLMFIVIAAPVLISGFILWWLAGFPPIF